MRKRHIVWVNGEEFAAYRGDTLLDAALLAGIDLPHDCRAGQCGSCAVNLVDGQVYGGQGDEPGTVLACQCRIITDIRVAVEDVPEVTTVPARVTGLVPLTSDAVELRITPSRPAPCLPGQYFRVRFRGFPERCYSPTVPMDRPGDGRSICLHIRRVPGGRVSSALGRQIRNDHRVKLIGPFGSAFLREGLDNRLVLVATGTGFAPIWSIATAALNENPNREMVVVVGGKTLESLYMVRALHRLAHYPAVKIIPVASTPQDVTKVVRHGRPTDFLPELSEEDIVYVCGAPLMVAAVKDIAKNAGASCYADPFLPQGDGEDSLLARALSLLTVDKPAAASTRPPGSQMNGKPTLVSVPGDTSAPPAVDIASHRIPQVTGRKPMPARPGPRVNGASPAVRAATS